MREQSKAAMRGRKARKVNVERMICGNVRVRGDTDMEESRFYDTKI